MEKCLYRPYILVSYKQGKTATVIYNEMLIGYGDRTPSYRTVCRWVDKFKSGSEDICDNERSGRPITATNKVNIKIIEALIKENPRVSYTQIEALTSLHPPTIYTILHEHLQLKRMHSKWIPHHLTDNNKKKRLDFCKANLKQFEGAKWRICDIITGDESWVYYRKIGYRHSNSVWVKEGEYPEPIVRRGKFEPKSMISIFFKSTGPVLIDVLDKGKTIDANYYVNNCLKSVIAEVKAQRPKSGTTSMKILHDNAKPHAAILVNNFLENEGIAVIPHPPYSPDLAPCDYWLFGALKRKLGSYDSAEELKSAITEHLFSIPVNEYRQALENYVERLRCCIKNEGDYFEHLL